MRIATDAVRIFGGYGCGTNHPVERRYRDAEVTRPQVGSNRIRRLAIGRKLAAARQ